MGVFDAYITERTNGIISSLAFAGTFASEDHIHSSLTTITQRDVRIIVGLFGEKDANNVLCRVCIHVYMFVCDLVMLQGCIQSVMFITKSFSFFLGQSSGADNT